MTMRPYGSGRMLLSGLAMAALAATVVGPAMPPARHRDPPELRYKPKRRRIRADRSNKKHLLKGVRP